MWQNTCLSLSCKTSLYYNAIYFTKVSYTVLFVFHKCFELIQWAMYMGRHASSANIANITVSRAPGFSEPFIQKSALCRGWLRQTHLELLRSQLCSCAIQIAFCISGIASVASSFIVAMIHKELQITKKSCLTFISFPISWKHKGIRIGESPNILLTPPIIGQSKVWRSPEQERRGYSVTSTSFNSHPHFPFLEAAFPQNLHLSITLSPLSCARSLLLTIHTFYSCCRHGASSVRRIWS